jgi:hypothetical protein
MTGFDLSHVTVTNGVAQNLRSGTTFDVIPTAAGDVTVIIPANAFNGASFASNTVTVNYSPGACTPTQLPIPSYGITYSMERTNKVVLTTDEYSYHSDMSGAVRGSGSELTLTPGQDVWFRSKASGTCWLASDIQHLVVPARPAVPSVSIDFANEQTVETIGSDLQYSTSSSYTYPVTGIGSKVTLTPGQDLYFWVNVTSSSFYSLVTHLIVPARPFLNYTGGSTITSDLFTLQAVLDTSFTGFDLSKVLVTNGVAQNLRSDNIFDVVAGSTGEVRVIIPYNAFNGSGFASNEVVVSYDSTATGIPQINKNSFSIYLNPNNTGFVNIKARRDIPTAIDVYSASGSFIRTIPLNKDENQQIDLQDLQKGMYFLNIHTTNGVKMEKLVLE